MKVLRFDYNSRTHILNISDINYTLGNTMAVIDVYFKGSKIEEPDKLQLVVTLDNIDEFMQIISNKTYIELNQVGDYIEDMTCYYRVTGYVLEQDKSKVESYFSVEPEEKLLEYYDTVNTEEDVTPYEGNGEIDWEEVTSVE